MVGFGMRLIGLVHIPTNISADEADNL